MTHNPYPRRARESLISLLLLLVVELALLEAGKEQVSTVAGDCKKSGGTNGDGDKARFMNLTSITADPDGNLYVADTGNHAIRKLTLP